MPETMDSSTQTCDEPGFGSGARAFTSPRVEIDTSAPFASVEEAVIRFGGRGFWIPRDILHSASSDESEEVDVCKLEEQATEMLKDLNTKQQETLNILEELELTRRLIEHLKLKLQKHSPAALVMLELKQAKQNLSQRTNDVEAIRACVEHVNKKMASKREPPRQQSMKSTENLGILRELDYEAEQFMRTAEAAKGEVLKAMSDIEESKTGLKMIEMRWAAAKKLEEAAKATEALALAEIRALSSNYGATSQQKQGRINPNETSHGNEAAQSGLDIGRQGEARGDAKRVSLNQMLDRQRARTPPPPRRTEKSGGGRGGGGDSKSFFSRRKGFGFVHISLPLSKQSKSRIQSLSLW